MDWIADVIVHPGEDELEALAEGALRVLREDAAAMELIRNPGRFDVIVTENLFGDYLLLIQHEREQVHLDLV